MTECGGQQLPAIVPAQVYSFNRAALTKSLARPKDIDEKTFESAVKQAYDVTAQIGGNYGITDGHRALNYLITRYAQLYELVARQLAEASVLVSLRTQASALTAGRRIVDVILNFRSRKTQTVDSFIARVDVSDLFPFLVTPVAPYIATS